MSTTAGVCVAVALLLGTLGLMVGVVAGVSCSKRRENKRDFLMSGPPVAPPTTGEASDPDTIYEDVSTRYDNIRPADIRFENNATCGAEGFKKC